jgi:hypothetical protein
MDSLNEEVPEVHITKSVFEIGKICQRARTVLEKIKEEPTQELIEEMLELDITSTNWRGGPEWTYKTVQSPHGLIQLHRDVWTAYEWNYHRTARMLLHDQILMCFERVNLPELRETSVKVIHSLADEILSTVPQMMGDIDSDGKPANNQNLSRGIGAYFLLWPIRIIRDAANTTREQKETAETVFQRIRECTGMKIALDT